MAGIQRLLAIVMAFSLTGIPVRAKAVALGIIAQADKASLGAEAASEGTTIYDGDRLSTGAGGSLQLILGEAQLYLADQSSVIVHNQANGAKKQFETELISGTIVLSATAKTPGEVVASAARVRPIAGTRGVVQVRLAGLHELIVFARRGPAEICYWGECTTIPEGKSYRVLLNPPSYPPPAGAGAKATAKTGEVLVLIAVGVAAAGIIAATWGGGQGAQQGMESPDKP